MKKAQPELISLFNELPSNKKLYFASDFHLGIPNRKESLKRERKIVQWLQQISKDAAAIFLVGDLFDFWFEYHSTIPKGFVRFQGKIAELTDQGIPIFFFTGNHDLWMKNYFSEELNVKVIKNTALVESNGKKLFIGHGDGLGPGDTFLKGAKAIFKNKLAQWLFGWIHPNIGLSIANFWSKRSRMSSERKEDVFEGENEMLFQFCKKTESATHHDYYLFGHRHLPGEMKITENSSYINLGDWVRFETYVEFDGENALLKTFAG